MMPLCLHKTNRGFTLIELLVAMVLGLVVLGAVLNIFVSQNRTNAVQQEVAYAQQNVRAAMDLMAREIRGAGYDPTNNGFDVIPQATSTLIQVRTDYRGDNDLPGNPPYDPPDGAYDDVHEDITYTLNGSNQLTRDDANDALGPEPIVDFVNTLQFGYVLRDGTVLDPPTAALSATQMSDVRAVIVRLGVRTENTDPNTGQFRVRNLVSRVRIRNVGFKDLQ